MNHRVTRTLALVALALAAGITPGAATAAEDEQLPGCVDITGLTDAGATLTQQEGGTWLLALEQTLAAPTCAYATYSLDVSGGGSVSTTEVRNLGPGQPTVAFQIVLATDHLDPITCRVRNEPDTYVNGQPVYLSGPEYTYYEAFEVGLSAATARHDTAFDRAPDVDVLVVNSDPEHCAPPGQAGWN